MSRAGVSLLMNGKTTPSMTTLARIQETFGVGSEIVFEPLETVLPTIAEPKRFTEGEENIEARQMIRMKEDDG